MGAVAIDPDSSTDFGAASSIDASPGTSLDASFDTSVDVSNDECRDEHLCDEHVRDVQHSNEYHRDEKGIMTNDPIDTVKAKIQDKLGIHATQHHDGKQHHNQLHLQPHHGGPQRH